MEVRRDGQRAILENNSMSCCLWSALCSTSSWAKSNANDLGVGVRIGIGIGIRRDTLAYPYSIPYSLVQFSKTSLVQARAAAIRKDVRGLHVDHLARFLLFYRCYCSMQLTN